MATSSPPAGGILVALLPMVGAVIGLYAGEPSVGFLAGLAVGVLAAVAIWLRGRE